jgi:hypothetical protein
MSTSRKPLYLTRSEIFAAAWRRFRAVHGAKATPRQAPAYWAACLRMMWQAAKGDAFVLCAIRDDQRREAAAKAPRRSLPGRRSYSRGELRLIANFAA